MQRAFKTRAELIDYLRDQFPDAAQRDDAISGMRGGRQAGLALLQQIDPKAYGASRNALDGAVSRLSPYIRHGALSLTEVRDYALTLSDNPRADANKFVFELAYRDYFQHVYAKEGVSIWDDLEPYKTGFTAQDYADQLPADILNAATGVTAMDAFIQELYATGYLHNHARMWLAAYVVHWRRIKWQAGARWFLQHLLDGDPASNNLSWQWVASTFSHKPYFFNLDNLHKYSGKQYYDRTGEAGHAIFDASYETLAARLFPNLPPQPKRPQKTTKKGKRRQRPHYHE